MPQEDGQWLFYLLTLLPHSSHTLPLYYYHIWVVTYLKSQHNFYKYILIPFLLRLILWKGGKTGVPCFPDDWPTQVFLWSATLIAEARDAVILPCSLLCCNCMILDTLLPLPSKPIGGEDMANSGSTNHSEKELVMRINQLCPRLEQRKNGGKEGKFIWSRTIPSRSAQVQWKSSQVHFPDIVHGGITVLVLSDTVGD